MKPITIVDARTGRGKSSAAIQYMNDHKDTKHFLYVTPFLTEVNRICKQCGFEQPESKKKSKSSELKKCLRQGKDMAATHALFYLMDDEALDIIREKKYSLIIDENIQVVERLNISKGDFDTVIERFTYEKDGLLHWKDKNYTGQFSGYKEMADANSLCTLDGALLNIMNPNLLRAFDEVFMLTYLFDGQYQKAYLEYYGFKFKVVGVECTDDGYMFSDMPDNPPPIDYHPLINIVDNPRMNEIGNSRYSLSKAWFARRGHDNPDIRVLRNNLRNFYRGLPNSKSDTRLWTTFKEDKNKLVEPNSGRFKKSFLQIGARATNEFRDKTDIAYLVNRFVDPNLMKFFRQRGIVLDADSFALGEMLQWIWRSAIRDDKPINLYIPSKRMRTLLTNWIDRTSKEGGAANAQ